MTGLSISCQSASGPPLPSIDVIENSQPGVVWKADGIISNGEYQNHTSFNDIFSLYWANDKQFVYLGMQVGASGWISIAILPDKKATQNLDIIMGSIKNGQTVVLDMFNPDHHRGNGPHQMDTEIGGTNDILAFGGKEQGGWTTIELQRKLITGDKYDQPLQKGINYIAWAYGDTDNTQSAHVHKGYGSIELK